MGLELRQDISQMVYPLLVQGLERLKNEGRLGLPLLAGRLEPRGSLVDLVGIGPPSLLAQLFRLLGGIIQLPGHRLQVRTDCLDILHLLLVLEVPEGLLDVLVDALGKQLVRGGNAIGRLEDLVPGRLEDAVRKGQLAEESARKGAERRNEPELGGGIGHLEDQQLAEGSNILLLDSPALLRLIVSAP